MHGEPDFGSGRRMAPRSPRTRKSPGACTRACSQVAFCMQMGGISEDYSLGHV